MVFRFLAGTRDFCLLQSVQTVSGNHPVSCWNRAQYLTVGVKWPRRETDHTPHLVPRLKMSGAIPVVLCTEATLPVPWEQSHRIFSTIRPDTYSITYEATHSKVKVCSRIAQTQKSHLKVINEFCRSKFVSKLKKKKRFSTKMAYLVGIW
jgi:hypothetical protein